MAKIKNVAETAKRKRIINAKECEYELRESLEKLFDAFWNAVRNYEKEVIQTPFTARCRGFEASLLNSKIIQSVQSVFKDDWTFGKYKRFMLRVNGYIMLFKKLNSKNMPMNVPTRFSSSIQNQEHIFSLLERNGIIIIELDYDVDLFDGVSFLTDGGYYVIIINKNFSNDHKRFTLAHELGHLIMHTSNEFLISEYRDKEDEANRFASEFLMPSDAISNSLRGLKLQYLVELKRYWLTSMASIVRRAKDLKCITNEKYKYFSIELSRRGYRKSEPVSVYIDMPNMYNEAYKLHKNELEYSNEEMATAFSLPIDVLTRFCCPTKTNLKLRLSI